MEASGGMIPRQQKLAQSSRAATAKAFIDVWPKSDRPPLRSKT
jgi:hypothetical protein